MTGENGNRLFIETERTELDRITRELGGFSYKAPTILSGAANAAGKYAVRETLSAAEKRYDYNHAKINLASEVHRQSATYANPRTIISVKSRMNKMIHFNVTPGRVANVSGRPDAYKGRVLKSSSMDVLRENGVKAFMVRFEKGGIQVVSRVPGEKYSGGKLKERMEKHLDPTKIEVMHSPSDTHMFSRAFDDVDEKTHEILQKETKKRINKFLKGAGG